MHTAHTSSNTLHTLHRRYAARWGKVWPFTDDFLAELWQEAKETAGYNRGAGRNRAEAYEHCLIAMRETHEF